MAGMRLTRAIAPVLVVWLSGVACLLVCASMCARTAEAAEHQQRHACCARSAEIEAEESCDAAPPGADMRAEASLTECCLLTARASTRAPLPQGFAIPLAPAVARVAPTVAIADGTVVPIPTASAPVLNRGDTHLRCCVFLI